ncbi:DUF1150 family protein [Niveispirillum sp. SYP-B3756]|uniref:DUF1150 family protein n=1 Tax=Niveispirillum sp. SYP-B3756 TaxID=2662178 RepID=UPI001290ED30|nr:DUF1150 family protein [Niveispirillum sp. SYP-B3756]MQP66757.1 DUF1150 family protein [Niveispirillum sp. SYP-B3756]
MNQTSQFLRTLTVKDFAVLGVNAIAYVKPVLADGQPAFSIHAADGTALALVPRHDLALATVRQHDMEPLNVH